MKQRLKQSVIEKFEPIELSEEKLALLEDRLSAHAADTSKHRVNRRRLTVSGIAAVLALAIGIPLGNDAYRSHRADALIDAIALEAVNNHLKLKPLEIESPDLGEVLAYFEKLDFDLVASESIAGNPGDRLLGGRYCTIQGIDAAQLRIRSGNGELSTWYEGILPPEELALIPGIDNDSPAVRTLKGLQVRVWREYGVVFVTVR